MENKSSFDLYYFITTQKMESQSKSDHVIAACSLQKDKVKKIQVVEDSVNDILNKLSLIKLSADDTCMVNITGGTKLMTFLVYKYFFENYNENSCFYYMPIDKNVIEKIHPFDQAKYIFPIECRLNIKQYVKSVGLEIEDQNKPALTVADFVTAKKILNMYISNTLDYEAISKLRKISGSFSEFSGKINISGEKKIIELVNKIGKFSPDGLYKREADYITGGWFEEYVYFKIKNQLGLSDKCIDTGIKISNNEFDVIFIHNNTLFVVECKTGLKDLHSNKSIINDTIYKAVALNKNFGLRTKSFIFTLDTNLRNAKGDFKDAVQKRLNDNFIKLADRKIILNAQSEMEFINSMFRSA